MMRCAQSLCMAVILRPQMRHSSWTSPKRTRASGGLTAGSCGPFLFGCNSAQLPSPPRQHEVGRRGTPMDDALRPVDLDRRPVGLHRADLAAGGQHIPPEVGGTLSPRGHALTGSTPDCSPALAARPPPSTLCSCRL